KYRTTAVLYPSGGFGRVSEALAGVVKDRGGEVLTGHRVDRIATEPGPSGGGFRATGVVVEGNEIKADSVICTIPVFHLPPLFDDGVIAAHKDFFDRAEEGSNASSRLALLICGGRQVLFDKPRNTWVFVPRSQLEEFGEYFLISELDSSQGVAPPGKQILTCATLVEGKAPDLREFRVKMERELKRLFPKLDLAQADWITAQYFPVVDGIARTIDWYGETRIGPATPVKNFFVAGDTTREYSTGTDGCANSAYLAAGQVLGRTLVRIEDVF
ncbi:MAG: FAD-dependent oxidoreductase, partial [Actinomycetota bacterium]